MKFIDRFEKSKDFWFLLISSFVFFLLRFPSLFEPNWYGDESIYQVIGIALTNGRLLYSRIWDNKPPLLYIFYGLFHGDQFSLRLLSLIFGILSIITFFFLARKLFFPSQDGGKLYKDRSQKVVYITTLIYTIFFGLPLLEGNIANAENFMHLPILLAACLALSSRNKSLIKTNAKNGKIFFASGLLLGLAFIIKVVAIFDATAFLLFLIIRDYKTYKDVFKTDKKIIIFAIGGLLPITLSAIFFLFKGAFSDFFKASFIQNVGYVGYGNKLIIPQGFLLLKLIVLFVTILYFANLFKKKKSISESYLFITLWFAFSLFDSFFSQRPYTHYVLTLLPSICLLLGSLIWEKKGKALKLGILFVSLILILRSFTFYGKTFSYYPNFLAFITGAKKVSEYQEFFDKNTVYDYELAEFIKLHTNEKDNIYLWGNNAEVYALSRKLPPGRYIVAYHVTFYKDGEEETQRAIDKANPKYIIAMENQGPIPFVLSRYRQKIMLAHSVIYERAF